MNRIVRTRFLGALGAAALTAAVSLGAGDGDRSESLDQQLLTKCADVMGHLQKQGYKNVAVMKFRVQIGKADPRFDIGRLGGLMATRLENALIMTNEEFQRNVEGSKLIGITRGASQVAASRDRNATFLTPEGRAKLFSAKYPLAWGDEDVSVDALLTGVVRISPDLGKAKVVLQEYAPGAAEPTALAEFEVTTNRLLLADLNRGFFLAQRSLKKQVNYEEGDEQAVKSAVNGGKDPGEKDKGTEGKPPPDNSFESVLDFDVYYDGKKVELGADGRLPTPKEKQEVYFELRAKERIGLILKVNGVNTLRQEGEEREPDEYSMWVLDPGKTYTIRGHYTPEGKVRPFRVLSDSDSVLAPLADDSKRGKIEMSVFRAAPQEALPDMANRPVRLRAATARGKTFKETLKIVRNASSQPGERGILVPGEGREGAPIRAVPFSGVLAGHRVITYYEANKDS